MLENTERHGMRIFLLIWFGLMISQLGSGITSFALGIWVYQQTGSATQLTLISFFTTLPAVVVLPVVGALVDRWDRRWALILSEAGASLTPLILVLLFMLGHFEIWPIYLVVAISAIFRAFQFPAFSAAITQIVPKRHYGRSSGMLQIGFGISQLLSPALAGVLLEIFQLRGIFLLDIITFAASLMTLMFIRIPRPKPSAEQQTRGTSIFQEIGYGWKYILARPGLLGLLLFLASSNFALGLVISLSTPLILSFATADTLGVVVSVASSGFLFSSILMSIWGGPARRTNGVLAGVALTGVAMVVAGLAPSALLIAAAGFVGVFGSPIVAASSQAIWQRKVASDVQGRVFATRSMIAISSAPLAYLVGGPLADYVFNPLLVEGGPLANTVGRIIGVGPGRGIGLLFIAVGFLSLVSVAVGYSYPRLRLVEDELPDAPLEGEPASPARDEVSSEALIA